jgi:hypothetical protein
MKRFIVAAALSAAAVVPVSQAGAVPPGNAGAPLGSQGGCFVVATPAPVSASCNFLGGPSNQGVAGFTTGGYKISHQKRIAVCDNNVPRKVTGFTTVTVVDENNVYSAPSYIGDGPGTTWPTGIVQTLTILGNGFAVIGGSGTPSQAMATNPEPVVGPGPAYAGAENGAGSLAVGDNC